MNNDVLSTPSAPIDQSQSDASTAIEPSSATPATAKRSINAKHLGILQSLLASLDIIYFIQLSVTYYLDARLLTFLLRAVSHLIVLSPRQPSAFQPPTAVNVLEQPVIGLLFSTNVVCLLAHLISDGPRAGEITQFYSFGGILVDYVGEKTPVSKIKLILLDGLILTIQLVMLSVTIEKESLSKSQASLTASETVVNAVGAQDLDAEERGITAEADDPLLSTNDLDPTESRDGEFAHPLDSFSTGRRTIADINLSTTVARQWKLWKHGPSTPAASSDTATGVDGVGTTPAVNGFSTLVGPFGFRVRIGGRITR